MTDWHHKSRSIDMRIHALVALAGLLRLTAFGLEATATSPTAVVNFPLIARTGKLHELRRMAGSAVVLFFTANGCPVARLSAPKLTALSERYADRGVSFCLVNANSADDRKSILKESFDLRLGHLPVLKDDTQGVARHLGVKRTCEC